MSTQPGSTAPRRGEKEEKERDEEEKRHEKDEKARGEKWSRDPLSAIVWAAILVWAGLVLLADNLGMFQNITIGGEQLEAWSVIFVGAGLIVLLEVLIRLVMPAYRRAVTGSFIFAIILLGIGLGGIIGWGVFWPLILIAIGVAILIGGLFPRR